MSTCKFVSFFHNFLIFLVQNERRQQCTTSYRKECETVYGEVCQDVTQRVCEKVCLLNVFLPKYFSEVTKYFYP